MGLSFYKLIHTQIYIYIYIDTLLYVYTRVVLREREREMGLDIGHERRIRHVMYRVFLSVTQII